MTGTTIGENTELLALWTPGSCNVSYPEDVGGQLPANGKIMVQWHHSNETGGVQPDGSKMTICTVPEGSRPHVGGITVLGTENLGGPIGMSAGKHEFSGSCVNDSGAPITVFAFMPQMRALGRRMRSVVQDARGATQTIFDEPFVADQRVYYLLKSPFAMQPGATLTSTCTYENDTGQPVGFGVSAQMEMCFQLAFSYPHAALNNGAISLIGMTNTCW